MIYFLGGLTFSWWNVTEGEGGQKKLNLAWRSSWMTPKKKPKLLIFCQTSLIIEANNTFSFESFCLQKNFLQFFWLLTFFSLTSFTLLILTTEQYLKQDFDHPPEVSYRGLRSQFFFSRRDKTRLEATSRMTRLLVSGPVVCGNPGNNPGNIRDETGLLSTNQESLQ